MKPHIQAVREAQAWDRILAAVEQQARAAGVEVNGLAATHRDPELQRLFRMEALADFLESTAQQPAQETAPEPAQAKKASGKVTKEH